MLCCAFAAFILSQIVFAFDSVRERVFGVAPSLARESASAAWRLGDPAPLLPARLPALRRGALALGVSLLVACAAFALSLRAPASSPIHAWHPSIWCSSSSTPAASGE